MQVTFNFTPNIVSNITSKIESKKENNSFLLFLFSKNKIEGFHLFAIHLCHMI